MILLSIALNRILRIVEAEMANIKRQPTEDPVIDRIEEMLKYHKKTKKELLEYIGIDSSMFTTWRYANGKSYMKYINAISDFLGVSVEYLLNGTPDEDRMLFMEQDEIALIKLYRILDSHKKELLIDVAKNFSS